MVVLSLMTATVRRTIHADNHGARAADTKHKQVTCKLWDRQALDEPGVTLDVSGRRRLIAPVWKP